MKAIAPLLITLFLLVASPASALSPSADAYGGQAASLTSANAPDKSGVAGDNSGSGTTAASAQRNVDASSVPFNAPDKSGVAGENSGPGTTAPSAQRNVDASSLPFTGADIGLILLGAVMLLGVGMILRRSSARPA